MVIFHMFQTLSVTRCTFSLNMQPKEKKEGPMTLEEAVVDSENLTDFLLDFDED